MAWYISLRVSRSETLLSCRVGGLELGLNFVLWVITALNSFYFSDVFIATSFFFLKIGFFIVWKHASSIFIIYLK